MRLWRIRGRRLGRIRFGRCGCFVGRARAYDWGRLLPGASGIFVGTKSGMTGPGTCLSASAGRPSAWQLRLRIVPLVLGQSRVQYVASRPGQPRSPNARAFVASSRSDKLPTSCSAALRAGGPTLPPKLPDTGPPTRFTTPPVEATSP
jgi:hypothetical protein